jgi:hypothetical protein
MSDLHEFGTEFAARVRAPDLAELAAVAQRRRGVTLAVVAAAGVAAVLLIATLAGVGPDRAAETPARTPTTVGSEPESWSAADIISSSERDAAVFAADDGSGSRLVRWERCGSTCAQAYEYTAPDGRRLRFAIGGKSRRDAPDTDPEYLGNGDFYLPGCVACTQMNTSALLLASAEQPVRLERSGPATGPGPGLRLVDCGTIPAPCVLDVASRSLAPLYRETLPAWARQSLGRGPDSGYVSRYKLGEVEDRGNGLIFLPSGVALGIEGAPTAPLLIAGEEIRELTFSPPTAPPLPGTEWVDALGDCPCVLDTEAATLTPIQLPVDGVRSWAHSTQGGFWGLHGPSTAQWIGTDGLLKSHDLGVPETTHSTRIADGGSRGEMAFYVTPHGDAGQPGVTLHVSVDRGKSWQVRAAPFYAKADAEAGRLTADWNTWPLSR